MVSRQLLQQHRTQNYIYDGQDMVLVLNASGQVIAPQESLWPGGQPGPGHGNGTGRPPQAAGPVNWDLTDNQGTVRDVVQSISARRQTEEDHLVYDSCGQIAWQSSATDQPTLHLQRHVARPPTAMDYDNARWYTAVDAVFASQDPIGFRRGQTNLSEYCGNSPTNCVIRRV